MNKRVLHDDGFFLALSLIYNLSHSVSIPGRSRGSCKCIITMTARMLQQDDEKHIKRWY